MVQTNQGEKLSRSGSFILNKDGMLVTPQGFPLMGENGPIRVNRNNFQIKPNGEVWINADIGTDPKEIYGKDMNEWKNPVLADQIQIRNVEYPRHLNKIGESFYETTPESGEPFRPDTKSLPEVQQGFLEISNVNVVSEMTAMIEVQRAYEMNQKAIQTHDTMLGQVISILR